MKLGLSIFKDAGLDKYSAELQIDGPAGKNTDRLGAGDTREECVAQAIQVLQQTKSNIEAVVKAIDDDPRAEVESTVSELRRLLHLLHT